MTNFSSERKKENIDPVASKNWHIYSKPRRRKYFIGELPPSLAPYKTKYKTKYITQGHARRELENVERQNLEKINHFQCQLGLFRQLWLQIFTEAETEEWFLPFTLSPLVVPVLPGVSLLSLVVSIHFIRALAIAVLLAVMLPLRLQVKISLVDISRWGGRILFLMLMVVGGSITPDPRHGGDGDGGVDGSGGGGGGW